MAKKIRFPLEMKNGVEVRTIEELKENFSLENALQYLENGKLSTWLRDRYLDEIAVALEVLNAEDSSFKKAVCDLFEVEYDENVDIDMEKAAERNRKLKLLKEVTADKQFIDAIDQVAFDQDDLYDLLDEDEQTIYLCGKRFSIPLGKMNIKYIGINEPVVLISAKEIVDFDAKGISFENCHFDDNYKQLVQDLLNTKETVEKTDENVAGDQSDDMRGQVATFVGSMTECVDDFIKKVTAYESDDELYDYGCVTFCDSYDYDSGDYDYSTKAKVKTACKEAIQSAISDAISNYEDEKDNIISHTIDHFIGMEDAVNEFVGEFLESYDEYMSLDCEGETEAYIAKKKNEIFEKGYLEDRASKIYLNAGLYVVNRTQEMKESVIQETYDALIKEMFDTPAEKLLVAKKYFEMCTYDNDGDDYCFDMDEACVEINRVLDEFLTKASESFPNAVFNTYILAITELCDELKNKLLKL